MPTHEVDLSSEPARPSFLVRLVLKAFSFAYGTFSLGAFVLLALTRKNNFRRFDDKSRKELAAGMHMPVAFTIVLS
jgi:hypothetical protein